MKLIEEPYFSSAYIQHEPFTKYFKGHPHYGVFATNATYEYDSTLDSRYRPLVASFKVIHVFPPLPLA